MANFFIRRPIVAIVIAILNRYSRHDLNRDLAGSPVPTDCSA